MAKLKTYKPNKEERYLRDLLALIHNDNGEHNTKVGLFQSTKDARKIIKSYRDLLLECYEAINCGMSQSYETELLKQLQKTIS